MPPEIELPWAMKLAFHWYERQPVFGGLLSLMLLDVLTGVFLSVAKKTLSSTVSWRGMSKKAIMLLIVGAAGVMQSFLPAIPMLNIVSGFYTLSEMISILESAAAAGVPLPRGLVSTLSAIRDQRKLVLSQKDVQTVNNVTVITPPPPNHIDVERQKPGGV